jgi:hypothetical protein
MPSTNTQNESVKREIAAVSIPRLAASPMRLHPQDMLDSLRPETPPHPDGKVMEESDTPKAEFSCKGDEQIPRNRLLPGNAEVEGVT